MVELARKCILIMAAGTGGHIFPALAIADLLKSEGIRVVWLGSRGGMEIEYVSKADIPIHTIDIGGLRGKGILRWLVAPYQLLRAFIQSVQAIREIKPDLILAMGGFVCGPAGIAAHFARIPMAIHEQNAVAGLTNKILANPLFEVFHRQGNKNKMVVLEAFPESFPKGIKAVMTGNPVRKALLHQESPEKRLISHDGRLKILILGGSRGAKAINAVLPRAMALISEAERPEIYHQTGSAHFESTQALYSAEKIEGNVVAFIDNMDKAYLWADLVICRAGAMTLAEICCIGVASMLIPFPYAVDDHQTRNAEYLSKASAAILVSQSDLTASILAEYIERFSRSRIDLINMAKNAYALKIENAAEQVVRHCKILMELL